jgi:hypothetical protein
MNHRLSHLGPRPRPAPLAPGRDASGPGRRPRRVAGVLRIVVALSLLDLVVTLVYMSTTGMFEGNPIVAYLARLSGSCAPIVMYKALTVLIAVSILYRLRTRAQAEAAAWLALLVLCAVTLQWVRYAALIMGADGDQIVQLMMTDPGWVAIS